MADRYERWDRGERDRYGRDDRGFMDRAGDEVRSWFGDDEAARRRARDEREGRSAYARGEDWPHRSEGRDTRQWSEGQFRGGGDWAGGSSSQRSYGGDYGREYDRGGSGSSGSSDYGRSGYGGGYAGGGSGYSGAGRSGGGGAGYGGSSYGSSSYGGSYGSRGSSDPEYDSVRSYREREGSSSGRYGSPYGANDIARSGGDPMSMGGGYGYGYGYGGSYGGPTFGRGQHSGRGPKGYQRSDERIREDVCDRLSDDPGVDASDIEVTVNAGEVTLSGHVRDRDDKRRAEDVVERISGVREVHNSLRVNRDQGWRDHREQNPGDVIGLGSSSTEGSQSNTQNRTGKR